MICENCGWIQGISASKGCRSSQHCLNCGKIICRFKSIVQLYCDACICLKCYLNGREKHSYYCKKCELKK